MSRLKNLIKTCPENILASDWMNWHWQLRHRLHQPDDFKPYLDLTAEELGAFKNTQKLFKIQTTPYYASLVNRKDPKDPIRKILVPHTKELSSGAQSMSDPLGERRHSPCRRVVHRYPDRVLFLITDTCSVYCRYCLRKYFTGNDEAFISPKEYQEALNYINQTTSIKEVILSGGDPMTLGDARLIQILTDIRNIDHVEIIRIATRMPVVCPMRFTPELLNKLRLFHPLFIMTHFNHPQEISFESAQTLELLVDHGFPVFNQMVLLRGINNDALVVQELSRKLLALRVKPYYMFQCDPSEGTDHFRTSITESLQIQKELWGKMSGLAMPNLSLDIPGGGGKIGLVPDFCTHKSKEKWSFKGWDGIEGDYINP
ncbi:MAG: KamA family radical SAM protein [Bdellovibrionales bacterium]|nr:KamA family radical SAM protein [Bdellovibrionales bacterium]